jgi:hypothetical protein
MGARSCCSVVLNGKAKTRPALAARVFSLVRLQTLLFRGCGMAGFGSIGRRFEKTG